jgi:hypothetical protein
MRQITGRTKNHDRARLRHRFGREAFAQGIGLLLFGHGIFPNPALAPALNPIR